MHASDESIGFRQLEALAAVARTGSVTGAARALRLSQPTVSEHLRNLERALGVRLAYRGEGRIRLTGPGRRMAEGAADLVRRRANLLAAIRSSGAEVRGPLRIGASTVPARYLLPRVLRILHRSHPHLPVTVHTGNTEQAISWVRSGEVDLAWVGGRPSDRSLAHRPAGEDRLVLLVLANRPLASRRILAPVALRGVPILVREAGSGTQAALEAILRRAGLELGRDVPIAAEVGGTETLVASVRAGLGVGVVSSLSVPADPRLTSVPLSGPNGRRRFHLVWRRDDPVSRLGRDFIRAATRS
jgi:DNA-binding transcriptional LysR family regulator